MKKSKENLPSSVLTRMLKTVISKPSIKKNERTLSKLYFLQDSKYRISALRLLEALSVDIKLSQNQTSE